MTSWCVHHLWNIASAVMYIRLVRKRQLIWENYLFELGAHRWWPFHGLRNRIIILPRSMMEEKGSSCIIIYPVSLLTSCQSYIYIQTYHAKKNPHAQARFLASSIHDMHSPSGNFHQFFRNDKTRSLSNVRLIRITFVRWRSMSFWLARFPWNSVPAMKSGHTRFCANISFPVSDRECKFIRIASRDCLISVWHVRGSASAW